MKFKPETFTDVTALKQALLTLIPLGTHAVDIEAFASETQLRFREISSEHPNFMYEKINCTLNFDKVISCATTLQRIKWPWSILSFSNGWLWILKFYFLKDELVEVSVQYAGNEL